MLDPAVTDLGLPLLWNLFYLLGKDGFLWLVSQTEEIVLDEGACHSKYFQILQLLLVYCIY